MTTTTQNAQFSHEVGTIRGKSIDTLPLSCVSVVNGRGNINQEYNCSSNV